MIKIYSKLLIATITVVGCTQNDDLETTISSEDQVSITVDLERTTKGSMINSEEDITSIGVYCAFTKDDVWSSDTSFDKMENQRMVYDTIQSDWIYDGVAPTWGYTSIVDRYTFMAYSPYGDSYNGITPSIQSGNLVVEYVVPQSCTDQPDLMMAIPHKDIYPQVSGGVALHFKHALSAISFSVKGMATEIITNITIKNVVGSGECTISDSGNITWELNSISNLSYSAIIDDELAPDIYTAQELTLDNGYIMMIPQECDKVEIEVTTYNTDERSYTTKTLSLSDSDSWEAGQTYDYTINLGSYDYTIEGTSNSYMLHPDGTTQIFYIPVEGRINTFWRYYADDDETYKDMLSSSDIWNAYLLWSDVDSDMSDFSVERVTSGFSPSESVTPFCEPDFTTSGTRSAMKITLPATVTEGNIVVAVAFNDQILWSWHLWVTDYDPDLIAARNRSRSRSDRYVYTARGVDGEVHRYDAEDLWSTLYDDRFIMDRNLGARGCDYASQRDGVLHYQFGRKDPFPASASLKVVDTSEACVSFAEAVQNPTLFYTRKSEDYSWSEEGLTMSSNYLWFDKNVPNSSDTSGKSIFDPSPLGWRVPRYGTFTVMDNLNCEYIQQDNILLYNDAIKLPMTGYRSNNSGNVNNYGDQGNLRLSTQISASSAYNLAYNPDIDKNTNNTLADGFCVRCIEE